MNQTTQITPEVSAQSMAHTPEPARAYAIAYLTSLTDQAMDLATRAHRRAVEADDAGDAEAADQRTASFTRAARIVPRLLAYKAHFEKPARTETEIRSEADRARDRARAERIHLTARRGAVRTMVEQSAEIRVNSYDKYHIMRDVDERLADRDMRDALQTRPTIEIVCKLCAELGIVPDVAHWSDEDLHIILEQAEELEAEELAEAQAPWSTPRPAPQAPIYSSAVHPSG
jgi:hypothetical protein